MRILDDWLAAHEAELIAIRRDLHAHPELAFAEKRTSDLIAERLRMLGLAPTVLPGGTGVICDIGEGERVVALRADIDALPLPDLKDVSYRSRTPGACHACGHDAHTAILLGVAAVLAAMDLPGRVRLIFQPAEEAIPGGAVGTVAAGAMAGVVSIYALHCDPRVDVGFVGVRSGPITAACDRLDVHLSGTGGHTGRPHLTADVVYALGRLITDLPGLLSRRVDPRAGLSLVWGAVDAGNAANAIPASGSARGTLRMLDHDAWDAAESLVQELVAQIVAPTWDRRRSSTPGRAWAARTSRGTSITRPARWPGSACGVPDRRCRSTCTSRGSTSTSPRWPSASGSWSIRRWSLSVSGAVLRLPLARPLLCLPIRNTAPLLCVPLRSTASCCV